ncbi:MAG: Hsp70 family protein [Clostridia bacterium]|jgi:rod shape-determining protein MreB|nr:Hsp70 family protein [Clostridia bacterium]MCI9459469.1 Hsp70 family protein [Clostridia bacterium]
MAKMDIAIDMGTSYTSILVSGNGIVLHEPSVIAYGDGGARAVGNVAYRMMGKAPDRTRIVRPITDGVIKDANAAGAMMNEFMKRILPQSYIIKPKVRAVLGVPTGITVEERKIYEEALMGAGVDDVEMVNSVMLAAVGTELPVQSNYGGFIVSIGGGATEIAVLSLCGIVTGCSINIGGDMIDRTLVDSICGLYKLKTDLATVRKVKENILSLVRNDCAAMTVSGLDIETKSIRTQEIASEVLYGAIQVYYKNIIDAVSGVINSCSPAVATEIQKSGITVVGGGANIPGLAAMMSESLGLNIRIPQDPHYAVIAGAGMLLSDPYLLEDIVRQA